MIGFNGGLIGKTRIYASTGDSSGVWTLDEIIATKRGAAAIGGTVTEITDVGIRYKVHTFTSSGSFIVLQEGSVDYLVVGGGGGGGKSGRGGGGGGGG